jgi:hypothetical protein
VAAFLPLHRQHGPQPNLPTVRLLRWHRQLFRWSWRPTSRVTVSAHRPPLTPEMIAIRDNDGKYGRVFAQVAEASGIAVLRTAYRAPGRMRHVSGSSAACGGSASPTS